MEILSGQQTVTCFIHQCDTINTDFDGTLNSIPHMIFATGKENNVFNAFKNMVAQPDKQGFLEAILQETKERYLQ